MKKDNNSVLYFDDEPFISRALAEHLKQIYHWEVKLVSEIKELFQELTINKYDIIILDIMTPIPETEDDHKLFSNNEIKEMEDGRSTGIVLAKKIWAQHKNTPILFLTARSRPNAIVQFNTDGKKCDYLRKPELAITVNATLNKLLGKQ